ncbi:glutamate synthase domain-containing protein 1 [Thermocatellispora tengchongensis]|uniref:Glutamine--fructose-6-phosphate aminotransferase [isomerizing] n=1 Tax=Thermocatellispora tengchongensis TaxID=1073253 RepID=A0A840P8U4_9ACTN|nr:glutamine amidotransferase [Thermocatellispora tengchongensis]MBB5135712.1 glutamate synthase domain-containing protein 1 [Thermocatellispora tengchongensis]
MCGISGIQVRDPSLRPRLGELLAGMLHQAAERGPDSAGVALYGDPRLSPPGCATVSLTSLGVPAAEVAARVGAEAVAAGQAVVVRSAELDAGELEAAVRAAFPRAVVTGRGTGLAVLKGVGHPDALIEEFGLREASGWQGIAHTRMATESAVTPEGAHPYSVGENVCLVHNGSFANHATIRRELIAEGAVFDSDNDTEVGARFVAHRLAEGMDLEKALLALCERFDGFYTLLVTTGDAFAVVRDAIACKPAVVAETDAWVAMASEYRCLAALPGIESARIFEPEPEEVRTWRR